MLIANNREAVAKSLVLILTFGFVIIVRTIATPNVSAQATSPVIEDKRSCRQLGCHC